MKVLGILWEQNSTAALMIDGRTVACVSEERFSRVKNEDSYPKRAVESVLAQAGVDPSELDVIAFAGERFDPVYTLCHKSSRYTVADRLREQREYWYPRMYQGSRVNYLDVFADKLDLQQYPGEWADVVAFLRAGASDAHERNAFFQRFRRDVVVRHLGVDPAKIVFPHHHRCHAFYAYYGSPIRRQRTLVLTADAWGDDMNASVSVAGGGTVERISSATNFNLARLYRSMTLLLGMKPDEHEYKVMGLAPYAKDAYITGPLEVFRNTLAVSGMGFTYREEPPDLYVYFRERLEGFRFDSIAGALQKYAEELIVAWTQNCLAHTGARHLCFGGGLAMNIKAMMEVARLPGLDGLFVCPSPSDDSLAMGACYVAAHDHYARSGGNPDDLLQPLEDAYLGPDLSGAEVTSCAERLAASGDYVVSEDPASRRAAELLASGKILGRCAGRSEFGARALGNRSILADPRDTSVVARLNEKVKSRDFWMPFAPSVLAERASDYLVNPKRIDAPYMTIAFETTPLASQELRAGLHQADRTARPQIVRRQVNPGYHRLLTEFERVTGVGGVLNTSFNIHGEPIVQTAEDAVDVLRRSGLDGLILGDRLIEKRQ